MKLTATLFTWVCLTSLQALAQESQKDFPNEEVQLKNPAHYFLIGPKKGAKPPEKGFGLLVVLPGGDGSAEFNPFVQNIYRHCLGADWLVAQPVAVKWHPQQEIVWPTAKDSVPKKRFSTEQYVEGVVADVKKRQAVDSKRILLLAWSSSGPAAYAIATAKKRSVTGFYIAMSVFRPASSAAMRRVKGTRFVIDHSPEDKTCPFRMAKKAHESLVRNKATVKFLTYTGGHGWRDSPLQRLKQGLSWLVSDEQGGPAPSDK